MRRGGLYLLAGTVFLGTALGIGLAYGASGSLSPQIASTVEQAQQAMDDAVYLPAQVNGRWELSGRMRTWLQPSISTISDPWRWAPARCAVLDPALAPGMRAFMLGQIGRLFGGSLAGQLKTIVVRRIDAASSPTCLNPNASASGPPGPLIDHTTVGSVAFRGNEIIVHARVAVDDWQSGVSHVPTPGNGRRIGWRLVRGLLNSRYTLRPSGRLWKVVSASSNFAPGHEP